MLQRAKTVPGLLSQIDAAEAALAKETAGGLSETSARYTKAMKNIKEMRTEVAQVRVAVDNFSNQKGPEVSRLRSEAAALAATGPEEALKT